MKRVDVHRPLGFDDKAQLALGFDHVSHVLHVLFRAVQTEDVIDLIQADALEFPGERPMMIDHVVCAERPAPVGRLGPRRGGDDTHARQLFGQLNRDRSDAARAADNQNAVA